MSGFTRAKRVASCIAALIGASVLTVKAADDHVTASFFVTSVGLGNGGKLGGLEGADRHCQALAAQAGLDNKGASTWRAYLSVQSSLPTPSVPVTQSVNAKDRIGNGPWHNTKGALIASSIADLHSSVNRISSTTALNESGKPTLGRLHDILTGTRIDGTAPSPLDPDMTCKNWTSDAPDGSALVGHHDRASAIREDWATSWNSAHMSRGCSPQKLSELGSGGLFYCFKLTPK